MRAMARTSKFKKAAFFISTFLACLVLYLFCTGVVFRMPAYDGYGEYEDSSATLSAEGRIEGKYETDRETTPFKLTIISGYFKGERVSASCRPQYKNIFSPGDRCVVKLFLENSQIKDALILGPVRDKTLLLLFLLFLFMIMLLAGTRGLRIILSLAFAFFLMTLVFVPLSLKGTNAVLLAVIISASISIFGILTIGGWNRKSAAAIIGTFTAFIFAGLLPFIASDRLFFTGLDIGFGTFFHLDNFLWYSRKLWRVNFSDLLIAGILISSLGAIMDIAMTISTSVNELRAHAGVVPRKMLFRGGVSVGVDVLTMMSITVLFVFVGADFESMLLFSRTYHSIPSLAMLINYENISSELVRILSCEIGLLLAVPFTALTAAFLSGRR